METSKTTKLLSRIHYRIKRSPFLRKLKRCWYFAKLIFNDEPVRTWRKLDGGKYMCDGDCGRWSLHGVCTCGLCHYFKIIPGSREKIQRSNTSWRREYQTQDTMRNIEYNNECPHGLSWDNKCEDCEIETQKCMEQILKDLEDKYKL
jgi:hypothetical protein